MQRGFTLIEMLIVIAIFGIFLAIFVTPFVFLNKEQALTSSRLITKSVLADARSKTVSSENDMQHGVYIEEGSSALILFSGAMYSAGDPDNVSIPLHTYVDIESVDLAGGSDTIVFNRVSGSTANHGTILLGATVDGAMRYATITIFATGVIE